MIARRRAGESPEAGGEEMVAERANERVCYFNGEIVPESRALVSFRDRSFRYGDGAFDTTRTFGHRIFKLEEHIVRFYKTLRYLRIDPGMAPSEMKRHTEEVLARNLHLLGPDEDYWVFQRISRGLEPAGGDFYGSTDPVLIIDCTPLPIPQRAHYYRDGIPLMVPSNRRAAPDTISPRAKTHNYLSLFVGNDEVRRRDPNALALFLDHNGNLSEGIGSNIFLVTDGVLYTPQDRYVLNGISRETVLELAAEADIEVVKCDLDLFDAHGADEAFVTSTSYCVCPVATINDVPFGERRIPGPVTERLMGLYCKLIGFDFVGQYLKHLH